MSTEIRESEEAEEISFKTPKLAVIKGEKTEENY